MDSKYSELENHLWLHDATNLEIAQRHTAAARRALCKGQLSYPESLQRERQTYYTEIQNANKKTCADRHMAVKCITLLGSSMAVCIRQYVQIMDLDCAGNLRYTSDPKQIQNRKERG